MRPFTLPRFVAARPCLHRPPRAPTHAASDTRRLRHTPPPPPCSEEFIVFALRDALARSAERVIDVFREWDMDGSGTLTADELRQAMKTLGFGMLSAAEIGRLVAKFDGDGDGLVDYLELNRKLREVDISRPPKHKLIRTSEATAYKHEVWRARAPESCPARVRRRTHAAYVCGELRLI